VRICRLRPHRKSGIPLICQLAILDDIKRRIPYRQVAREFGVDKKSVEHIVRGIRASKLWDLPPGFELLVYGA
jgi:predicted regulator of amino acid metabolism with ACT domain